MKMDFDVFGLHAVYDIRGSKENRMNICGEVASYPNSCSAVFRDISRAESLPKSIKSIHTSISGLMLLFNSLNLYGVTRTELYNWLLWYIKDRAM